MERIVINAPVPSGKEEDETFWIKSNQSQLFTIFTNPENQKATKYILVQDSDQELEIITSKVPYDEVKADVNTGQTFGSSTGVTGSVTEILGILGVVLSADQTGATLKFSQVSKLISRLRFVDVNYG